MTVYDVLKRQNTHIECNYYFICFADNLSPRAMPKYVVKKFLNFLQKSVYKLRIYAYNTKH